MGERARQWVTVALFLGVLVVLPLASLVLPKQTISEIEARALAEPPVPSRAALVSGRYFKDWETYLSDHVALRDEWLKAYSFLRVRVLGDREMNNVFVGRDGWLMPVPAHDPDLQTPRQRETMVATATAQVVALDRYVKGYGGRFLFVAVPSKGAFMRDEYPSWVRWPAHYDELDERFFSALRAQRVDVLDMTTVLEQHRGEQQLYYKTDHHWTFAGAFLAYTAMTERLGLKPLPLSDFDLTTLPNPFVGTYNRELGMAFPMSDHAVIAAPKTEVPYTKTANRKPEPRLYFTEADPKKAIWYGVYMGGDFAEIVVDTGRPKLPDVLLVGDSYTNALEPLFFLGFDETRVVDMRAYRDTSLFDYVAKHKPPIVVVMLGGQSWFSRTGNGNFGTLHAPVPPASASAEASPAPRPVAAP